MYNFIIDAIEKTILSHKDLMKIALRQKAKFEEWLKFELAAELQKMGMKDVMVEGKARFRFSRTDITISHEYMGYDLELKTSNTNWKNSGVLSGTKPITKNIRSII